MKPIPIARVRPGSPGRTRPSLIEGARGLAGFMQGKTRTECGVVVVVVRERP